MSLHALRRSLRFSLLLHWFWSLFCLHFGFRILSSHLRWYLLRLQFGFVFGILLRRWFSDPFLPSFRFLIPSSVLVLVPLSMVVSAYDPIRDF